MRDCPSYKLEPVQANTSTRWGLKEQGILLEASEESLMHIADEGYEPTMGARPLKRVMQKRILNELSKRILGNYITKDFVVMMELGSEGDLRF